MLRKSGVCDKSAITSYQIELFNNKYYGAWTCLPVLQSQKYNSNTKNTGKDMKNIHIMWTQTLMKYTQHDVMLNITKNKRKRNEVMKS